MLKRDVLGRVTERRTAALLGADPATVGYLARHDALMQDYIADQQTAGGGGGFQSGLFN